MSFKKHKFYISLTNFLKDMCKNDIFIFSILHMSFLSGKNLSSDQNLYLFRLKLKLYVDPQNPKAPKSQINDILI